MASRTEHKPLAAVREPLDCDKGYDVIDSRTGKTLAWRGSRIPEEAFAECRIIADLLNATFPDRVEAPTHESLVEMIIEYRQTDRWPALSELEAS